MKSPDYYDVLELSPSAQPEEIEAAYIRLIKAYGVEGGGSNPRLALLRLAHSTLSDPTRRAAYDLARRPPPPPASAVAATTVHEAPASQGLPPAASTASKPTSDSIGIALMFAALFIVMKVLEAVFTFVSNNFWPLVGIVAVVAMIVLLSRKKARGVAVASNPVQPAASDATPTLERSHELNIPIQQVEDGVDGGDLFALPHLDGNVEATVLRWMKTPGEVVASGDTLVEVQAGTSRFNVWPNADVTLAHVRCQPGDVVRAGDIIAVTRPVTSAPLLAVAMQEGVLDTASAATGDTGLPDHVDDSVGVVHPSHLGLNEQALSPSEEPGPQVSSPPPLTEDGASVSNDTPQATRSPLLVAGMAVLGIATLLLALVSNSAVSARTIAESKVRELETQLAQQEIKLQTAVDERNRRQGELEETRNQLKMVLSSVPARQIWVTNGCFEQVRLVIRYLQSNGEWHSAGWWTFSPGQSSFITADGQQRLRTPIAFYYYAEGTRYRWEGQNETSFENRTVKMRPHTNIDGDGDYNMHLTCN